MPLPFPLLRLCAIRGGRRVLLLALFLLAVPSAHADDAERPILLRGRESAIEHLFDPFTSGQEVTPGWRLGDMAVNRTMVDVQLQGDGKVARLHLKSLQDATPQSANSQSFATTLDGPPEARAAADKLIAAIAHNDHGGFWSQAPAVTAKPSLWARAWHLLTDAVLLTVLALLGLAAHLRAVLKPLPRQVTWALIVITLVATALRAVIAVPIIMNAWPYTRIVPPVRMMAEGQILPWFLHATGRQIAVFDAMFHFDFLVACLTPAAIFAHARYVLGDWRSALVSAAVMAVLPMHIRFSHADSELILTLGLSSLSFLALYASMRAERARDRWLARPILLVVGITSYFVRPEAVALAAVDIGAIVLTAGVGIPLRRRITAGGLVALSVVYLLVQQGDRLLARAQEAGERNALWVGITTIGNPARNPIIDPWITPPLLVFLMFAGAWWLWRTGARGKLLYLGGWLVGMFFIYYVHGIPAMQARYHLSLATPFVLLVGAGTPWVLTWQRKWLRNAVVVVALLSPLLHLDFERDVDFTELHEFQFVRAAAALVPDGCTVLEYMPMRDPEQPLKHLHGRWDAVGRDITGKGMSQRWPVVDAEDWLKSPPAEPPKCLYFYDGLTCRSYRPDDQALVPACATLRAQAPEVVTSTVLPYRFYDMQHAGPFDPTAVVKRSSMKQLIPDGEPTPIALRRIR